MTIGGEEVVPLEVNEQTVCPEGICACDSSLVIDGSALERLSLDDRNPRYQETCVGCLNRGCAELTFLFYQDGKYYQGPTTSKPKGRLIHTIY